MSSVPPSFIKPELPPLSPFFGMKIRIIRMSAITAMTAITIPITLLESFSESEVPVSELLAAGSLVELCSGEDMIVPDVSEGEVGADDAAGVWSPDIIPDATSETNSDAPPVAPPMLVSGIFSVIIPPVSAKEIRQVIDKNKAVTIIKAMDFFIMS